MSGLNWEAIQIRLNKHGFDPGPVDGLRGRRTIRAVKRFQEAHGLVADGIVGPATYELLVGTLPSGLTPRFDIHPWFDEALRLQGLREDTGPGSNPVILDMAKALDIAYSGDDLPWCGLFVGHCIGATLPDEPLPSNPLSSRAWERFGIPVSPQKGAVMVFWRESMNSGLGHAGFYHSETVGHFYILGGNQGDEVSVARVSKDRYTQARWPITGLTPDGTTMTASGEGEAEGETA